jgi:hypothetical protein
MSSTSTARSDPLLPASDDTRRKSYSTPTLTLIGAISALTDGGSMGTQEVATPMGLPWRRI